MVNVTDIPPEILQPLGEILNSLGNIGHWLQAIGLVVILWLIFQIVAFMVRRKSMQMLSSAIGDLKRIEIKLDKLLRKK